MRQRKLYCFWLSFFIGLLVCLGLQISATQQIVIASESSHTQFISHVSDQVGSGGSLGEQALARYNAGQYREAIALWTEALAQTSDKKDLVILYTNLGAANRQIGDLAQAIAQWEQAVKLYRSMANGKTQPLLAQVLTDQAQAYSALGQFRVAVPLLQTAVKLAQSERDPTTEAAAQGALGNAYAAAGDFEQAIATHRASLELAATLNNPRLTTTALSNLGTVLNRRYKRYLFQASSANREGDDVEEARLSRLAQQDAAATQSAYERGVQESKAIGGILQARALLNLAHFLQQLPSPQQNSIDSYYSQAMAMLEGAPNSRAKAYALINLALSYEHSRLGTAAPSNASPMPLPSTEGTLRGSLNAGNPLRLASQQSALTEAIAVTRNISDQRAESFALGILGQLYEQEGELGKAMELTQQAQFAAQQVNAADSLYRWQAQAGRIYKAIGQNDSAVSSYRQAIATLQSIRSDIATASKDLQFDLRDSVEPVYRELMALLLDNSQEDAKTRGRGDAKSANPFPSGADGVPLGTKFSTKTSPRLLSQSKIEQALQVSELLQLSELQNFFGDECVQVARSTNDPISDLASTNTAAINSIILSDRTYMSLRLPDGSLNSYPVALSAQEVGQAVDRLRFTLEDISTDEYLVEAQKVYDLLIRPMAADLARVKPRTLVFINDGVLRNVPMAALHDGKQFLVEKYAIASTLGLNLTANKKRVQQNHKALTFGLSVEIPPFAPLPNVKAEVQGVQKILGGEQFLDNDFTLANLQKQIRIGYPIVHLATHGKFGTEPSSTFLQVFDRRVSLTEMEEVLRQSKQPIELLTLSACQTAAGDNRSTLGIAGVALRAGVQSTLASLWFVNDADTVPLIENFYTQMQQPGLTKAEALRQAQLKVIADPNGHPAIWSPFVLVGNWQ